MTKQELFSRELNSAFELLSRKVSYETGIIQ